MADTERAVDSAGADQRKDLSTDIPAPSSAPPSMEDRKEWPLGDREVGQLRMLKGMYKSKHVNLKPAHLLDTEEYEGWTALGKYYKAVNPLRSKDFEMASVDSSCAGFLLEFVDSCLIYMRAFKLKYLVNYRHHPVALVVNEFHHFAMYLSTVSSPEQAIKEKISQRIELIGAFANGNQHSTQSLTSMMYYSEWLDLMMQIREVFESIQGKWDLFLEQQTIQEQLNRMSSELTMVVKRVLIYQFYVLNGRARDFAFDPSRPSLRDVPENNLAEGLVYMVISNELVCEALNVSLEGGWDKLSQIFEGLKLPIPDSNVIQNEPLPEIKQYIDESHETGLASKYVIHEGSVDQKEFSIATEKWLKLLPKIVGVAGCVNVIRHAHRISGLGGDLLMAKHANKQVANAIFDFVENCLTSVLHDVKDLQRVLTGVSGRGSSSRAQRVLASTGYRDGEFEQWKANFSFSGSSYEAITQSISNLLKNLASLKTRVNGLKVDAVERKIRTEGGQLLKCIGSLFKQFDQWHDSKLSLPDSETFCMPIAIDGVATDVDHHDEERISLPADTLPSARTSTSRDNQGRPQIRPNTSVSESTEEAPMLWTLRRQVASVPPALPSETTPSMQFRADMAEATGVASDGRSTNECKTDEEKTLTMQYEEELQRKAVAVQNPSHISEADSNGHSSSSSSATPLASATTTPARQEDGVLDSRVGLLDVSITDRRSEASFRSQASFRRNPKQSKKCPRLHDLESLTPFGLVALLQARLPCDECGVEITRRAKRYACLQCPNNGAIRWCGQAPGYTMCTACAEIARVS